MLLMLINQRAEVYMFGKMVKNSTVIGLKECGMERALQLCRMVKSTMECTKITNFMDQVGGDFPLVK